MDGKTPDLEITVSVNAGWWNSIDFLPNKWMSKPLKIKVGHGLSLTMFLDRPSPVRTPFGGFDAKGQSPRSWVRSRLPWGRVMGR